MSGYYKMHRGWMDHPLFTRDKFTRKSAWIWLIENALWEDRGALKRGQISASVRELEKAWKWPRSTVSDFLRDLKSASMIRTEAGQFCNIITICNYEKYQTRQNTSPDETRTKSGHNPDTGRTPIKEGEEGKKEDIPLAKANGGDAPTDLFGETPASNVMAIKPKEGDPPSAPTVKKLIFEIGLPLFMATGRSRETSAKIIGRFLREHGEERTYEAITETVAKDPGGDPVSYAQGVLKGGNGFEYDDNGNWSPFGHPRPPGVKRKPEKPWSPFH